MNPTKLISVFSLTNANERIDEEIDRGGEGGGETFEIIRKEKKRDPNTIAAILQNYEISRERMKEQYYNRSRQFSLTPLLTQWKQHIQNIIGSVRSKVL